MTQTPDGTPWALELWYERGMLRLALTAALALLAACPPAVERDKRPPATPEPPPAAAPQRSDDASTVQYTLRFPDVAQHYVEVEVQAGALGKKPDGGAVEFYMPIWTPGSYLVREYSRNVEDVAASTPDGKSLPVEKSAKNRWRVEAGDADRVVLRYRVYGREMTVRSNFVDSDFAMLNGAPTFVDLVGGGARPRDVLLELPKGWKRSMTGLAPHPDQAAHHYIAADFDELVDSPIVAGNPEVRSFEVSGVPHELVVFGELDHWDFDKSARDVEALTDTIARFWGTIPYQRYVYLNGATGSGGGLEHLDSTLMLSSAFATEKESSYEKWLGLVSHEFFHTWNVKRLRPRALGPFDYEAEQYTPSLWIAEGITSYYDDLLLLRAGLLDEKEYIDRLSKQIAALETTPGRRVQPLSQSSFDAWIKHYRPDENTHNTAISYYTKGAVVAFLLDAEIRRRTFDDKSLDDGMRLAYERYSGERGYTPEEFRSVMEEVAGGDLGDFWARYVDGTEDLDYASALDYYGLVLDRGDDGDGDDGGNNGDDGDDDGDDDGEKDDEASGWLGVSVSDGPRLEVRRVDRETPAYAAGLNVGDELIAIEGYRIAALDELLGYFPPGESVTMTIARRGKLRELTITLGEKPPSIKLAKDRAATAAQLGHRARWLGRSPVRSEPSH